METLLGAFVGLGIFFGIFSLVVSCDNKIEAYNYKIKVCILEKQLNAKNLTGLQKQASLRGFTTIKSMFDYDCRNK